MYDLGRDQESDDRFFAKSLARFQPMNSLNQNEAVFVAPNENGSLLSNVQNALRDLPNHLWLKSFSPLHRHINLVDGDGFRFKHSFYSLHGEAALWASYHQLIYRLPLPPPTNEFSGGFALLRFGTQEATAAKSRCS